MYCDAVRSLQNSHGGGEEVSIRIRSVVGVRVALCAAETDEMPGDVYLDDSDHYALAAKFAHDWHGETNTVTYPEVWAAMATQKVRDAREELERWRACYASSIT